MGCSNENDLYTYVNNFNDSSFNTEEDFIKNRNINFSRLIYNVKSRQSCVDKCLIFYKFMAFKPRSSLCLCFKRLTRDFKEKFVHQQKCEQDFEIEIHDTGSIGIQKVNLTYQTQSYKDVLENFNSKKQILPRIVFFLTLNGRSIRQVLRLIKTIFDEFHYYYIHVDERMVYLREQIETFIKMANKKNIYMAKWQMSTIWGGASLLQMHLKAFKELNELRDNLKWNWDFVLNLSESDFPIK